MQRNSIRSSAFGIFHMLSLVAASTAFAQFIPEKEDKACQKEIEKKYSRPSQSRQDKYGNISQPPSYEVMHMHILRYMEPGQHSYGNNQAITYTFQSVKKNPYPDYTPVTLDCVVSKTGKVLGLEVQR